MARGKKVVLTALNARYFHSNLAVRCLKGATSADHDVEIFESTINDKSDDILEKIVQKSPDAVGFSCYIWNIEKILNIADNLKKILPDCFIFFGGPEVSYDCISLMKEYSFIDMIIKGEGEAVFKKWIDAFESGEYITKIPSIVYRANGDIIVNPANECNYDLNVLPFLYDNLEEYDNKIIYYETSRGCPYRCAYCMSGLNGGITYMGTQKVIEAFEYFIQNKVKQVKMVDRTFNYPAERAHEILRELIILSKKYPDSSTNFHFEITAVLVDDTMIEILKDAPKGLIQFEIGIQSTNPHTLKAIHRSQNNKKLFSIIRKLVALDNIMVYVDLIAGLPHESYERFAESFNDAFMLNAHKIHLGFLKLLKGTDIREKCQEYGIAYTNKAPYKVLQTKDISYKELCKLDKIEQMVDIYYNSGHLKNTMSYIISKYDSPFIFFEGLSNFLVAKDFYGKPQKITTQFDVFYEYSCLNSDINKAILKEKMQYDWMLLEKPRRYPNHLKMQYSESQKNFIREFLGDKENIKKYLPRYVDYSSSTISRMCHIAFFDISQEIVLFDYDKISKHKTQNLQYKT